MDGWELLTKHNLPRPIKWTDVEGKVIVRMFAEQMFPQRWYFLFDDGTVLCFHEHIFGDESKDISNFRPGTDTSECDNESCVPDWWDYLHDLEENGFPGALEARQEWEATKREMQKRCDEQRERAQFERLKAKYEK